MNYFSPGRSRLINDILSPFDRGGYRYDHPNVCNQPIGRLNRQFRRRYAVEPKPIEDKIPVKKRHAIVPPLATLGEPVGEEDSRAWLRYAAALALLILLIGFLWLVHPRAGMKSQQTSGRIIPIKSVSIPLYQNNGQSSGNSGSNPGSAGQSPAGATGGGVLGTSTASAADTAGTSGGALQGGSSGATTTTGGRGGGGTTATTGSGSSGSTSSGGGILPINLTIPPIDTSAGGKTLLDVSGTTITVN